MIIIKGINYLTLLFWRVRLETFIGEDRNIQFPLKFQPYELSKRIFAADFEINKKNKFIQIEDWICDLFKNINTD